MRWRIIFWLDKGGGYPSERDNEVEISMREEERRADEKRA
jgi:hypothetical protein